ncbi:MAG: hypothetical protein GY839_19370 [candidate division Zixibacteria bacterium]|nr:hypothetical protein [candidate division Zixibacteria bacterium]
MINETSEPNIPLYSYFESDKVGQDYINRRVDEAFKADAVYTCDIEEPDGLCLDIPQFDKYCIKKLEELRDKAQKSKTLADVEEYDSYACDVYYDRHDYIGSMFSLLPQFPHYLHETISYSTVLFPNYEILLEHYVSAKKLLLEVKLALANESDTKEGDKK